MKVLVTGGAGFIGSHLVDRLIQEGYQVVVVDNLSSGRKKYINKEATFYKMDILRSKRVERVFQKEKPEIISHHAAQTDVHRSVSDPVLDAQTNILGLLNLLDSAVRHGTRRIVFASSGEAVYGEQELFPAPEGHPAHPLSPYGVSKLSSEHYLYYYRGASGLEYTTLRYSSVYGPRQGPHGEAGIVAAFTQKMLKGEQTVINGNGMQTRDYIFVDDVVDANMAVINNEVKGTFNVGTGKETSENQLYRHLLDATDSTVKEIHGPEKKGEQVRSVLDWQKMNKAVDWEPRVSLQEGLTRTVAFFKG